jgi:hypothetical protein
MEKSPPKTIAEIEVRKASPGVNEVCAEIQQVSYGTTDRKKELKNALKQELPDIVDDIDYMIGISEDEDLRRKFPNLMATLVREVKEETGYTVSSTSILGVFGGNEFRYT